MGLDRQALKTFVHKQIAAERDAPLFELDRDFSFTYRPARVGQGRPDRVPRSSGGDLVSTGEGG